MSFSRFSHLALTRLQTIHEVRDAPVDILCRKVDQAALDKIGDAKLLDMSTTTAMGL
jgi:hypothetical protein